MVIVTDKEESKEMFGVCDDFYEGRVLEGKADMMARWARVVEMPFEAANILFTGCSGDIGILEGGLGETQGLSVKGGACSKREWEKSSVVTLRNSLGTFSHEVWLNFAHELGHLLGAGHSFENGQSTGGIMDYGDGTLNGAHQFHTFRREEICNFLDSIVNQCVSDEGESKFHKAEVKPHGSFYGAMPDS